MDRLTLLATHALASVIFGFLMIQHGGIDVAVGALSGAVAFLCLRHLHDTLAFARDRRELAEDLETLRAANLAVRGSHDDTRRKVTEITGAFLNRLEAHEKRIAKQLKSLEGTLSDVPVRSPASFDAAPATSPAQPRVLSDRGMLELVRRAIEENRVDLYLQPIVTLPQRRVRYYESLTRLRSADGAIILPAQYMKVAAPAGLMSLVDNVLLLRCVQLVRRLTQRTREIAVFCNISEQTLKDQAVFPQLLEFLRANQDLSAHIVLEFAQATVLKGGKAVEASLHALRALGFRFSMDQVTALDCDFSRLRQQGFLYVKLNARTLISGMKQANAPVAPEDFRELLARGGIDLIIEQIEDEKTVVQLLEFDIGYGQGFLFGEPKPLRDVGDIHDPRIKEASTAATVRAMPALAHRLAS